MIVLTGAGCSTESGIPDYRDDDGNWKYRAPMQFADFVNDERKRRQYWAQSFAGWYRISESETQRGSSRYRRNGALRLRVLRHHAECR